MPTLPGANDRGRAVRYRRRSYTIGEARRRNRRKGANWRQHAADGGLLFRLPKHGQRPAATWRGDWNLYPSVRNAPVGRCDPSGLTPPPGPVGGLIPTRSCKGIANLRGTLKGCCDSFSNFAGGPPFDGRIINGIERCLMTTASMSGYTGGFTSLIRDALGWIRKVCQGQHGGDVCVWCVSGDPSVRGTTRPPGWPAGCPINCPSQWGGAYAPAPVGPGTGNPSSPISNDWISWCDSFSPSLACSGLQTNPESGKSCAAIALCSEVIGGGNMTLDKPDTCSGLYHELIHTGGLLHSAKNSGTVVDFVTAMDCCLCKLVFDNHSTCQYACDLTNIFPR